MAHRLVCCQRIFVYLLKSEISIKEMKNKRFATGKIVVFRQKATFVLLFENVNKILMIQKITIEGYKSIKEQTVELFPINILIGGNGIGKSNFISAFTLIHNLYERNLQNYVLTKGGSDSLLYMGKKETDHLSFDLFLRNAVRMLIIVLL